MRLIDKRPKVSRREVLTVGAGALVAASIMPGGVVSGKAWAATPKALKPETFATLVQMSRDIYPHDRFADGIYAKAVEGLDGGAATDPDALKLLEDGVSALNASAKTAHKNDYANVGWEIDRVALLRAIETGGFFQKVRGHLVVGIYNQPKVWEMLGYEGESASKGGYINRGFNDVDWV
ncbi:MAG: gluconate 2-dehydrogenase subunit 3 family protein [Hyphomicrobiaceae bacterium]